MFRLVLFARVVITFSSKSRHRRLTFRPEILLAARLRALKGPEVYPPLSDVVGCHIPLAQLLTLLWPRP